MSNSLRRLTEVAQTACAQELPHGELTLSSTRLLTDYLQNDRPRETIVTAMKSFSAMCKLLMPGDAVDEYVRHRCDTEGMPNVFHSGVPLSFVPGWASDKPNNLNVWESPGVLNRRESMEKYTHAEVLASIELTQACPEIPLSLLLLQNYIGDYFIELRHCIAETDPQRAESLERFQLHWSDATNFLRATMMGLSLSLKNRGPDAIQDIDQELVTRAFTALEEMKAFDFVIPDLPFADTEALTFSCPVRPQLREMFIENGTFMAVVEKVQAVHAGDKVSGFDQYILRTSKDVIRGIAGPIKSLVADKDTVGLRQLNDLAKSRMKE